MIRMTLTHNVFLWSVMVVAVAGCATTKDKLGVSYALNRADTDPARTVDCGKVYWEAGSLRLRCSAFVSAEPTQVLGIVRNPYFSKTVSSPFFPHVLSSPTYTAAPVRFRYQAQADTNESLWCYILGRKEPEDNYAGCFAAYAGSGVIEDRWDHEIQSGRVTWQLHDHADARTDELGSGLFLKQVEFTARSQRLKGLEGTRFGMVFEIHPSHAFECHCPNHSGIGVLQIAATDQLRETVKEIVETVAAIARLTSGVMVAISSSEREALLPTEFINWKKEKLQ